MKPRSPGWRCFFRTISLATFAPTQLIFEVIVDLDMPITESCKTGDDVICGQRINALRPVSVRL